MPRRKKAVSLVPGASDHRGHATSAADTLPLNGGVPPTYEGWGTMPPRGPHQSSDGPTLGGGSVSGRLFFEQPSRTPARLRPITTPTALQRSISYPQPQPQSTSSSAHPVHDLVSVSGSTSWIHPQHAYRKDSQLQGSASFGGFDAGSARHSYEKSKDPAFSVHEPRTLPSPASHAATTYTRAEIDAVYRRRYEFHLAQLAPTPSFRRQSQLPSQTRQSPAPIAQAGPSQIQRQPSPRRNPVPHSPEIPPQPTHAQYSWNVYAPGNGGATRISSPQTGYPQCSQPVAGPSSDGHAVKNGKKRALSQTDIQFESIAFEAQGQSSVQGYPMGDATLSQGDSETFYPEQFLFAVPQEIYGAHDTDAQGFIQYEAGEVGPSGDAFAAGDESAALHEPTPPAMTPPTDRTDDIIAPAEAVETTETLEHSAGSLADAPGEAEDAPESPGSPSDSPDETEDAREFEPPISLDDAIEDLLAFVQSRPSTGTASLSEFQAHTPSNMFEQPTLQGSWAWNGSEGFVGSSMRTNRDPWGGSAPAPWSLPAIDWSRVGK